MAVNSSRVQRLMRASDWLEVVTHGRGGAGMVRRCSNVEAIQGHQVELATLPCPSFCMLETVGASVSADRC